MAKATKYRVSILSDSYDAATIALKAGDCICFTNADTMVHTVTDDSPGTVCSALALERSESGDIAPGSSYERKFDTVGAFPYHCEYMPSMKGTVTVTA